MALTHKFEMLGRMAEAVHRRWPAGERSQYLFVVGSQPEVDEMPRWRYFRLCQSCWEIVGLP